MINLINLIILTDSKTWWSNFWKVLVVIFIIVILLLAVLGFIGMLIEKVMKKQGMKVDQYMTNLVFSRLVDKPKEFNRIAKEKNKRCFYKASITPILFMLIALLIWVIYHSIVGNWNESIFDTTTGVGSLFYTFDFSSVKYVPPLGFDGITVVNTPHFISNAAMTNYFIFLFLFSGIIWYLINVQAYVARLARINTLKKTIYSKDLSTIDLEHFYNLNKVNPYGEKPNENDKNNTQSTNNDQH
ncbi:MAG: hypothetical protein WCR97_02295 [Bacilli bacterium]